MNKDIQKVTDWLIRGKDGKVHVVQFPNFPIIAWFVSMVIANSIHADAIKSSFYMLATAFLSIWSYDEITRGESRLRRLFGIIVAVALLMMIFR